MNQKKGPETSQGLGKWWRWRNPVGKGHKPLISNVFVVGQRYQNGTETRTDH